MKTKMKEFAQKVDVMIPDMTVEEFKEDGTEILEDVATAIVHNVASSVYLGSAIIKAVPYSAKAIKTGAKKGVLRLKESYDNASVVIVRR